MAKKTDIQVKQALIDLMGGEQEQQTKQQKQQKQQTKLIAIRMIEEHINILKKHFLNKGYISFSTGMRKVIIEYMKANNLID